MSRSWEARYCRCTVRLARDHPGDLCSSCEKALLDLHLAPPEVPANFWDTEQFRDAIAAQHIGRVSRAYRKHPYFVSKYSKDGIPQEVVGKWLGLTQAQISRIENGKPIRNLDTLAHWARTLRIPAHLLWFSLPDKQPRMFVGESSAGCTRRTREASTGRSLGPFQKLPTFNGTEYGNNPDAAAMESFRSADLQVGGGHLYGSVINYLQSNLAPRLFGGKENGDGTSVFTAAGALTEMAGWMAHDAGRDEVAQQHFGRALDLVRVGGDRQLGAHVLGSMSHLASHLGKPDEAIRLARKGRDVLRDYGARQPDLEARLLAMEARGTSQLRMETECTRLLTKAEKTLDKTPDEPLSPWVSRFDEGSLASETARCMRELGDLAEAERQAQLILERRPGSRTRSRAFGQLTLVSVLVSRGGLHEACAVAQEVLDATQSLGSYLVIAQLFDLKQLLLPHNTDKIVSEFLVCLEEALRERLWLYQWLTNDARGNTLRPLEGL